MNTMNPESRMWFYGLKNPMTATQVEELVAIMDDFVSGWKAHGAQLAAAYRIIADQFLIIAVDESQQQATGCSIDKSVHLLQAFGAKHGVDFFNRMLIHTYDGSRFTSYSTTELKEAISKGEVDASTQVLNSTAATLKESGNGTIDLKNSWAARYL